jgi:Succinate dehydrogenase/fumarate reductase, flavoprotein subunit
MEAGRRTHVSYKTDILVAGGGTAGVVAAIAAARSGMDVILVEQFGSLGGSAVNALVTPLMDTGVEGNPLCSSISEEINNRIANTGFGGRGEYGSGFFDPEMMKFVLEEMAVEYGVKLLYYTYITDAVMQDGVIQGIIAENKGGRSSILSKRVIDCTGDGDVCVKAGARYDKGDSRTGKNQPVSIRYIMDGVDIDRFSEFIKTYDPAFEYEKPYFHTASVWGRDWALTPVFQKAYEAGDITFEDGAYWQVFGIPGKRNVLAFNCPEIFDRVDGTNPQDLTYAQVNGKKAIIRLMKFYRKYFSGFEDAYITNVAPMVGIRESRRIKCLYTLSDEDVFYQKKFTDFIARSNYPVDIHGLELTLDKPQSDDIGNPYYEIPYRCLVVEGIKGLLTAGRCISSTFAAQGSLRIQPTARATGEAAGIAAALSIKNNVELADICGEDVRTEMIKYGARFT